MSVLNATINNVDINARAGVDIGEVVIVVARKIALVNAIETPVGNSLSSIERGLSIFLHVLHSGIIAQGHCISFGHLN